VRSQTRKARRRFPRGCRALRHKARYTPPADAPLTYTFNQARKYAEQLDGHGHRHWRVPTKCELSVLFQNRAAIGDLDDSGVFPGGWYWSSWQGARRLGAEIQRREASLLWQQAT
jgi:hypothetical protein